MLQRCRECALCCLNSTSTERHYARGTTLMLKNAQRKEIVGLNAYHRTLYGGRQESSSQGNRIAVKRMPE
jgi:hypothetical protein